ncbi:unnamed protein product [Camellia sinensis]
MVLDVQWIANPFPTVHFVSFGLGKYQYCFLISWMSGLFQAYVYFQLWMKSCKVIVLDISLLFEAKMDKWTNSIIVVSVDPERQLQRLMARDGASLQTGYNLRCLWI